MTGAAQYLLAIYLLVRQNSEPVAPGAIAAKVGRSKAATTEMLQRLDSNGWIDYEPYQGASLTPNGRAQGKELYETYETLSRFFDEVLELEASEQEAMELAGIISKTVATRLKATLLSDSPIGVNSET
ncbi:metal-dependent transcriptional regulator [Halobellus rarus]|uniref:Metal-dependent transcriptional regulator n=1 Tax=Halobellus rarus TaxID=1126237 RepID=A0ABD6CS52_9EURY